MPRTDSEQLTFLLPPFNKRSPIPKNVDWQSLLRLDGDELETHYRHVLESLGKHKGMLLVSLENSQEESKIGLGDEVNVG